MTIRSIFQPHFRLFYLFIWGIILSAIQHIPLLLALNLIFILGFTGLCLKSRTTSLRYFKRWIIFHLFSLFLWLTLSWKITATGIELNSNGIHLALLISLRMNLILFSTWLALWKISDSLLVQAISRLPLPQKLIQLFVLTVRYIQVIGELNQKMDIAMKARGYQPKANKRTFHITSQRIALLLIHALNRVERSEMALKARGFSFQPQPSLLNKPLWKGIELVAILLLIIGLWLIKN